MTVDISETLAPTSDQLDAIDLVGAPRTFTVESVSKGNPDQPVQVHLVGFPRVWRPSKGMRRVLAAGWGVKAQEWVGRSVTLFCDPNVMFGKEKVGGIRISHMSHLDKPLTVPLLVSRGKSATFTVQPLKEAPKPVAITDEQVADLIALMDRKGIAGAARLAGTRQIIGRDIESLDELTDAEYQTVVDALASRADVEGGEQA